MFYHIFSSFKEQQKEKFLADYVNQLKTLQMLRDQEEHDQRLRNMQIAPASSSTGTPRNVQPDQGMSTPRPGTSTSTPTPSGSGTHSAHNMSSVFSP